MSHSAGRSPEGEGGAHFRAHERRAVKLTVGLATTAAPASAGERQAAVRDISLAGAGLETDAPLAVGERLSLAFAMPTMWDPLVLEAVVVWSASDAPRPSPVRAAPGRAATKTAPRARAGVAFVYASPDAVLAMFEMLATLGYE